MTDPFSVAGTAVGITSLGIQVCQSLVRYYSQYRSFHDDIDAVVQRVEGLQSILNTVALVKNKIESSDEPSADLQAALMACLSAVDSLKKMAEKCNETRTLGSTQDVARLVKKRLLWPFKKETLADTQKALDGLQANLLVALQALGHLDKQSVTLQKIDEDIQTISSVQLSHTSNVTSHMTDISNQYSQLSLQMSTMEQTLSLLVSSDGRPRDPSKLPLGLLTDGIESTQDLVPSFRRNLRRYKKSAEKASEEILLGTL
ncbi:hypothetical protein BS50DRAFT_638175 [Corynespora cassiicola Philippines]|uniref:Azaphilone pigments biosynthesis cluster protein L N-terminal domain-containing protein n=1 Tax=Corynespora cassiicola Philippines TaxID=1448308 RepID=A0A2T2NAX9_CORCC|nr:hypothetical protein BS50DRAFT_638175 [Corynespora cassiicola Philippines]